jgi:hypothetical protein
MEPTSSAAAAAAVDADRKEVAPDRWQRTSAGAEGQKAADEVNADAADVRDGTTTEGTQPCQTSSSPNNTASACSAPGPSQPWSSSSPSPTASSAGSRCPLSTASPSFGSSVAAPPLGQCSESASRSLTGPDSSQADAEAERLARKALAGLQAEFALAGHELVQLADGSLIVSRWGMVRPLAMDEARAWLQRVTGRAGA